MAERIPDCWITSFRPMRGATGPIGLRPVGSRQEMLSNEETYKKYVSNPSKINVRVRVYLKHRPLMKLEHNTYWLEGY